MQHHLEQLSLHKLSAENREHLLKLKKLVREKLAARASTYDRECSFPLESLEDLAKAGLNGPTLAKIHGGMGLGPNAEDAYALWMMTKEIAKADLSLARCWEGHANTLLILDALCSESQKERWFPEILNEGKRWVAWSGEPQQPKPGVKDPIGTRVTVTNDGYILDGNKVFCSGAGGVDYGLLLVNLKGPGGARHAADGANDVILLAVNLEQPSITIDEQWWDPLGMRATVSHKVHFRETFIPKADCVGEPGDYLKDQWQTRFVPQYAASFLGAAEAAFDYALDYVKAQNRGADPYVQQHIGQMAVNLEMGHLWLRHVADLWDRRDAEAALAGARARHSMEHLAEEVVKRAIRTTGARSLNRPSPLERIYRDLSIYVRHDNDDRNLAMIGQAILGRPYDPSFFKP